MGIRPRPDLVITHCLSAHMVTDLVEHSCDSVADDPGTQAVVYRDQEQMLHLHLVIQIKPCA